MLLSLKNQPTMKKGVLLIQFLFFGIASFIAQNPYADIGKTTEVLTLSNGKYQEIIPNDTLVRIGTVLFNTQTEEIAAFLPDDSTNTEGVVEADAASRFLSVDPIAREYPELTPYQFAGNTPIQAIDMDGLEPFFVFGTNQNQSSDVNGYGEERAKLGLETTFTKPMWETINYITILGATYGHNLTNAPLNTGFDWSNRNGTFNTVLDRSAAAADLAEYVIKNHVKGEPVTLIGYSHGGNVALQAAPLIYKALGEKVNIISMSTPASNETERTSIQSEIPGAYTVSIENPRWKENPENPEIQKAVKSMYHFWIANDMTVGTSNFFEGSNLKYESNFPKQYLLDERKNPDLNKHGWPYYSEIIRKLFADYLLQPQANPKEDEGEK